ncbi:MAG: hypothetical protein JW844_07230 [Candidatus Omnitrophica bacterium]|nr:hypothetical protein [Candidatus Omnitrophota bacterium]
MLANKTGKVLIITIIIGLACGILLWYGLQWLLASYVKPRIEDQIQKVVKRTVVIEEIGCRLDAGVYIKNLAIFAKDNQTVDYMVNTIRCKFPPIELLRNRMLRFDAMLRSERVSSGWIMIKGAYSFSSGAFESSTSITLGAQPILIKITSPSLHKLNAVHFSLTSKQILLAGSLDISDETVTLKDAALTLGKSRLALAGSVRNIKTAPLCDLSCKGTINLGNAKDLLVQERNVLLTCPLSGNVTTTVSAEMPLADPSKLAVRYVLSAETLLIQKINLNHIMLSGSWQNYGSRDVALEAAAYGGTMRLFGEILNENTLWKYTTTTQASEINLEKLAKDIAPQKKNIAGTLNAQLTLQGSGLDKKNVRGQGWCVITEGRLGELRLLGDVAALLDLPRLKTITFEEAQTTFTIAEEKISTDDLVLKSPQVVLNGAGSLGFDQTLRFDVSTQMSQEIYEDETAPQKLAGFLIMRAGTLASDFTVTGTLSEPKLKLKPVPVDKAIGQIFQFFQDIRQATSSPEQAPETGD